MVKLIEEDVQFGWVGGVSAGSSHTVNYLSRDAWRAKDSFVDFAHNPSFGGVASVLRGTEVPQVLFRLSRWENLEHAEKI